VDVFVSGHKSTDAGKSSKFRSSDVIVNGPKGALDNIAFFEAEIASCEAVQAMSESEMELSAALCCQWVSSSIQRRIGSHQV
jgi:hypothetical protein